MLEKVLLKIPCSNYNCVSGYDYYNDDQKCTNCNGTMWKEEEINLHKWLIESLENELIIKGVKK